MPRIYLLSLIPFLLIIAACSPQTAVAPETTPPETLPPPAVATEQPTIPEATEAPTEQAPAPSPTSESEEPELSFEAITYRDEAAGFEFDYPAGWELVDLGSLGDRGAGLQLTAGGEPQLDVTLLRWDPQGDLDAFVATRKQAWAASGFTLLSEEEVTLEGGQRAGRFVIETPDGEQALFFFTAFGDRYLQLSGDQNLELLAEISGTVRPFAPGLEPGAAEVFDCTAVTEAQALEWVACNVIAGLRSRNLSALHGFMANPFTIGYWGSEGRSAAPEEITAELGRDRLPPDPSNPLTFTADRAQFPPLAGTPPEALFGLDKNVALILYSQGWGPDGAGAALMYFTQDGTGGYQWSALAYSPEHFDK